MILTRVLRALFVPLLALALITSTCSVAKAVGFDFGSPRAEVAGQDARAPAGHADAAVIVRIPLHDGFALAVHLGHLRRDAATLVADAGGSEPDHGMEPEFLSISITCKRS
ncbi:MAG: hypothetical protein R3288_13740 [Woeseiaceae bacterium]|nr:hypothetical protein [Woeseiaceae bacterium]